MKKVEKVALVDLQRGDELFVETSFGNFQISITGKRKKGSIALVTVMSEIEEEKEEFTARMPGGYTMHGVGLTRHIKVSTDGESSCLFFQGLKDLAGERIASSNRTAPIQAIKLKRK